MTLPVPTLNAEVTYPTTGSAGPFSVPFPYISQGHVKVYVDEVLIPGSSYTWPTAGTILFNSIPSGSYILFRRETPTAPLVTIASGSINPNDVNTLATQASYCMQEAQDVLAHTPRGMADPVAPLGTAAFKARASKFYANDGTGALTLIDLTGVQAAVAVNSLEVWVSKSASLSAADAAAVLVGGMLVVDTNVTLTGNTTLSAKTVAFRGGTITRGAFNLIISGSVMAPDVALFDKAGAGAVTISKGAAMVSWFGTTRDGATDDSTPLNKAFAACRSLILPFGDYVFTAALTIAVAGTSLAGFGVGSILHPGTGGGIANITANNVSIRNLTYSGWGVGFTIGTTGLVSKTIIEDVAFASNPVSSISNTVYLYTADDTWVNRCTFNGVTYGVIQHNGSVVNHVKVTNCVAEDMYADMVNFNGAGTLATDVVIENNTFKGSHNWTVPATEKRFVGLTSTTDFRIVNNWVTNCAGDAAVHLEDVGGRGIIQSNHFIDCGVGGGNDGYIYILNSAKNIIVADNWFVRNSASAGTSFISSQSGSYSDELIVTSNHFKDTTGHFVLALDLASHIGQALIDCNYCFGCDSFVVVGSGSAFQIRNCTIESVSNGVKGNSASKVDILNNNFSCSPKCILTASASSWNIKGNTFLSGDVDGTNCTDVWMTGNTFGSGVTLRTMAQGSPTRVVETGLNFKIGTGVV